MAALPTVEDIDGASASKSACSGELLAKEAYT
jgi:hypothetical protein